MKESKLLYFILTITSLILVVILTCNYLFENYELNGKTKIIKEYNELVLNNIKMDYDTTTSIMLNNEEKEITIKIPNLNEYKNKNQIVFDLTNIGNKDIVIKETKIENISSNVLLNYLSVSTSIKNYTLIKGGETKKVTIDISYLNKTNMKQPYYNFNVKFIID